ncbi:BolA family protein [Alteromonas gilva]|uniref:BolA family transcriptional regulator n=1 Tax=Alteromonas gilva TaxID=2987522 RepID=A0ABT5KZ85_9ALTE|nr:BolA family protein [Alteromonas gilva]MDC8830075.1 BolA family transcriptional regulator [Alteromonas gilva]
MDTKEIETLLKEQLALAEVHVKGDGSHYSVIAVSDAFADMSRVKRQQVVYAPLNALIANGTLHAVSIKTYTEKDWQRERLLNLPQ